MIFYSPTEKQAEFIRAGLSGQFTRLLFGGAMGGGKTYAAIPLALALSRIYAGSKWVIVRENLPKHFRVRIHGVFPCLGKLGT